MVKNKKANQEVVEQKLNMVEIRKVAPDSEFSIDFLDRMLFHMGGGSLEKYGAAAERYPSQDSAHTHITERFTQYLYTRNVKFLVDAANFAMIEFMHPSIENAFFEGTDSNQSPGRVTSVGEVTSGRNTDGQVEASIKPSATKISIETLTPQTEFAVPFFQGMVNRMAVSYAKYGALKDGYPRTVNAPESMRLRLEKYLVSGNTEFLMDVANFCMIEFMYPSLAATHYSPIQDLSVIGQIALQKQS